MVNANNMMGYYGEGLGFGFGWIFMIIFWGVIIWAIFALVRGGFGRGHGCCGGGNGHKEKTGGEDPLDILKQRYAKGEINKEEFDRIKKDLV